MNFRKTCTLLPALLLILFFFGCENEILDDAASMECSFRLDGLQAANGKLLIEQSHLQIASAQLRGLRDESETVNASKDFTAGQGVVLLNGDDPYQPMSIPVPSGNYTDVTISLALYQDNYTLILKDTVYDDPPVAEPNDGGDDADDNDDDNGNGTGEGSGETGGSHDTGGSGDTGGSEGTGGGNNGSGSGGRSDGISGSSARTGKTVDLKHFLAHARPSMMLMGTYTNGSRRIRVVIALDLSDKISFTKDNTDPDTLLLAKNSSHAALATFNTTIMLQPLTPALIESSELISFQGERILFIHKDFNAALFNAIAGHVQASASLKLN